MSSASPQVQTHYLNILQIGKQSEREDEVWTKATQVISSSKLTLSLGTVLHLLVRKTTSSDKLLVRRGVQAEMKRMREANIVTMIPEVVKEKMQSALQCL